MAQHSWSTGSVRCEPARSICRPCCGALDCVYAMSYNIMHQAVCCTRGANLTLWRLFSCTCVAWLLFVCCRTIRSNYFEDNNDLQTDFWGHHLEPRNLSFVHWNGSAIVGHEDVCTDILINGPPTSFFEADQLVVAAAADTDPSSSSTPPHDSASQTKGVQNQTVRSWQLAEIPLSNQYPSTAVTIEGNFHNPAGDRCYNERGVYAGVFAAGAEGLRVMSNNCDDFHHVEGRQLYAVKTGASPMANSSFEAWAIALNTGDWAATQTPP